MSKAQLSRPVIYTPSPIEFGCPPQFTEWRDGQDLIFWDILDSPKRFSIHNAPVGCGKSLAYIAAALASGKRIAVLTESKGLQDQLRADFGCVGLFDMRGLSNYTCRAMDVGGELEKMWQKRWGKPTCDIGPCSAGLYCGLKDYGCDYFEANRMACSAQMISSNYAYWIAIHKYGQGLGKFDLIILDEGHSCDSQIASAMSVELTPKDFKELHTNPLRLTAKLQDWRMWARVQMLKCTGKLDVFTEGMRVGDSIGPDGALALVRDTDIPDASELKFWKRLQSKCEILSESSDNWVIEQDEKNGHIKISPVWVKEHAEKLLFLGIPRIVITSATVIEKNCDLLGIPKSQREYIEYPSVVPLERRPIFWIPTVKLNKDSDEMDMRTWANRIDQIIERRLDRKGIIHTISYPKQQYLLSVSRFKHLFHYNTPGTTRDVVNAFRRADAPAILVTPSVKTGFDFPYDAARYQIIGKVPFRDPRGAIIKAQAKDDPEYLDHLVAQDLIQMYGRPNRAPKDYSETFIIDDQIEHFIKKRKLFTGYFLEAFQRVDYVFDPPTLEEIER